MELSYNWCVRWSEKPEEHSPILAGSTKGQGGLLRSNERAL